MEIKKNPKSNLENYSKLFIQLGLVLALFVVYVSMENRTYDKKVGTLGDVKMQKDMQEDIPIIERPEPPKPKAPPPPAPEKIEIVKDDKKVEETVIETTETDETEAVKVEEIVEADEGNDVVEDVPFAIIEEVPVFPGCTGTKKELTDCLNEKIRQFVGKKFNNDLAADLGLSPGKKRIVVQFRIGPDGAITVIAARAPHPKLKAEAIRVVKLLPHMTPGKQRGKPVGMKYTLPIGFNVE